MFPYIVGVCALAFLLVEMAKVSARLPDSVPWRIVRAAPFVIVAALSIIVAAQAPHGRKPFHIDFSIAPDDLAWSMRKVPHLRSIAVIFLLAVIAFGTRRLLLAFAATMLVGVGWELAESTVIRHRAAVSDLAPNIVSGLVSLIIIAGIRWLFDERRRRAAVR
jgi:hypothetical protein